METNFFEVLNASPKWDNNQLGKHVNSLREIDPKTKISAMKGLMNSENRMLHELFTFHDPDYETDIDMNSNYDYFIERVLKSLPFRSKDKYPLGSSNIMEFVKKVSPQMTHYLYNIYINHPSSKNLNNDRELNAPIYEKILQDLKCDKWAEHSLALLYERCAMYYFEKEDFSNVVEYMENSAQCWDSVLNTSDFYNETYSVKLARGTRFETDCRSTWDELPSKLVNKEYELFRSFLAKRKYKQAGIFLDIVFNMSNYEVFKSPASDFLEKMNFEVISEVERRFKEGKPIEGYSGDYDGTVELIKVINEGIKTEEFQIYTAGKYIDYFKETQIIGRTLEEKILEYEKANIRLDDLVYLRNELIMLKKNSNNSVKIKTTIDAIDFHIQDIGVQVFNEGCNIVERNLKDRYFRLSLKFLGKIDPNRPMKFIDVGEKTIGYLMDLIKSILYPAAPAYQYVKVQEKIISSPRYWMPGEIATQRDVKKAWYIDFMIFAILNYIFIMARFKWPWWGNVIEFIFCYLAYVMITFQLFHRSLGDFVIGIKANNNRMFFYTRKHKMK